MIQIKEEKSEYGEYSEMEIKEAAETLVKAEEIKKDSKMMPFVKQCMDEMEKDHKSKISSIADLRKIASEKSSEEDSDETDIA